MKLSLSIILYWLERTHVIEHRRLPERSRWYNSPLFLPEDPTSGNGSVIVLSEADLQDGLPRERRPQDALYICCGTSMGHPLLTGAPSIVVVDCASPTVIFNEIQLLFRRIGEWEESMARACAQGLDFQDLLDLSNPLFFHPVALQNKNFKLVAFSKLAIQENIRESADDEGYLSSPLVEKLLASGQYSRIVTKEVPYEFDFNVVKGIAVNIKNGGEFLGMLLVRYSDNNPLAIRYYRDLLTLLSGFIQTLLQSRNDFGMLDLPSNALRGLVVQVLEQGTCNDEAWEKAIYDNGLTASDNLRLALFHPIEGMGLGHAYFQKEIERMLPNAVAIPIGENLLFMVGEGATDIADEETSRDVFRRAVMSLCESLSIKAGVSKPFSHWQDLAAALGEAELASAAFDQPIRTPGKRSDASGPYCIFFDDIALNLLLEHGVGQFQPERICSSEAVRLLELDRERHSEYFATMDAYLINRFNAVATAQHLGIQRSTLFYRLKRIKETTGFDIDGASWEEILYLALSIAILRQS